MTDRGLEIIPYATAAGNQIRVIEQLGQKVVAKQAVWGIVSVCYTQLSKIESFRNITRKGEVGSWPK
jgi:hypothetical protein